MKILIKVVSIFLIIFALILVMSKTTLAMEEKIDTSKYETSVTYGEGAYFFSKAERVLTILRVISVIVAVISITILGIKYMLGSLEEKAQYKEKMLPLIIGSILIGSISSILISISNIMNS